MWIRTDCGKLINVNQYIKNINHTLENDKYKDNPDTWNNYFENAYSIKEQGDNLIDVLEELDMIITKYDNEPIMIVRIDDQALENRIDTFRGYFSRKDVVKVITHEQYMPLAQTINQENK